MDAITIQVSILCVIKADYQLFELGSYCPIGQKKFQNKTMEHKNDKMVSKCYDELQIL